MIKLTVPSLLLALTCSSLAHAGAMGETSGMQNFLGFFALEGGYSTTTINNWNFSVYNGGVATSLQSIRKSQHYTGIISAGMINMFDDQVGLTSELGWGYYGKSTLTPPVTTYGDFTVQHTVTGFDALIGLAWIQPNFTFSLKAGALIQNLSRRITATSSFAAIGLPSGSSFTEKTNQTAALPLIKLGGAYNFDNNWALTAAFQMALGSSNRTNTTVNANGTVNYTSNNLNPTINTLLLGVQYTC